MEFPQEFSGKIHIYLIYDRYPLGAATHVALNTIRKWLEVKENRQKIDRIFMCTFLPKELAMYQKLMPLYFPPSGIHDMTLTCDTWKIRKLMIFCKCTKVYWILMIQRMMIY